MHSAVEIKPNLCGSSAVIHCPLDGTVDLQGHRGARGKRPENTIPAFEYCIEKQMTSIEIDTNVTRDKQLIVNHDTTVNGEICRSENGVPAEFIPIKDLSVNELKKLDCGSVRHKEFPEQLPVFGTRLITLTEFFDFVNSYEKKHALSRAMLFNISPNSECKRTVRMGFPAVPWGSPSSLIPIRAVSPGGPATYAQQ